jgi:adenylate kinase
LLKDYQRLLEENHSMKELYNNFYQAETKHTPIPQVNMQTFSNKAIAQQLNSSRDDHKNQNNGGIMLKTMQKHELKAEMDEVRDEALGELTKIYNRAVEKANS